MFLFISTLLSATKGFSLRSLKFLVLDEADRMLSMDFEEEINKVVFYQQYPLLSLLLTL